jgi:hypothetical protein
MSTHPEITRFLQYLNDWWEKVLDDPSCVPGSNYDEKVMNLIAPHVPDGWACHLKARFSPTYGRRFSFVFLPVGVVPPTDFDIRFA